MFNVPAVNVAVFGKHMGHRDESWKRCDVHSPLLALAILRLSVVVRDYAETLTKILMRQHSSAVFASTEKVPTHPSTR